jgi:hypothetical protein
VGWRYSSTYSSLRREIEGSGKFLVMDTLTPGREEKEPTEYEFMRAPEAVWRFWR